MIYNINGVSVTWGVIVKNNVHILLTILFCKYILRLESFSFYYIV